MDTFAVSGLSFRYPAQARVALREVSFTVEQGQFVTLCGPSGCGKSTLLRQLKPALTPHGHRTGAVLFEGHPLDRVDRREQSARIGFVQQNPDSQIVTDKVWHELAFGLESLGCDTPSIRARVAEMASFFGIQGWFYRDVTELSGGQKQLLNLASIMAMQPSVLILDEPTSQLDPIAASEFLAAVGRINRELGTTILLTEHRLEEVFPLSDRVLVMDEGALVSDGTPRAVGEWLREQGNDMFLAMPAPMRICAAVPNSLPCPVTVRDGRDWLDRYAGSHPLSPAAAPAPEQAEGEPVLALEDVWFKYEKDRPDVVKGLSLTVRRGEFLAVLGGNGTGKTTMLSLMAGLNRPYRGRRTVSEPVGALPQNPQALFVKQTVREDLLELLKDRGLTGAEKEKRLAGAARLCRLEGLLDRHPYDLSGGEQQRAALAKVLLPGPRILLLDEPTKGLDAAFKQTLAAILKALLRRGVSIVMVSHDIEFCAEHAGRCALFFDGAVVSEGPPRAFFAGNSFYTTSANRMARHLLPQAVTAADVIRACGGAVPPEPELPPEEDPPAEGSPDAGADAPKRLFRRRNLPEGSGRREEQVPKMQSGGKLPRRTVAAAGMILLLIPLTIFVGVVYLGDRKYYFISLLVMLECMLPFFLLFEGRKPQARELVLIAALCAMGVAGRAAFFMLPQFKPVMALVILSGVALGGESGFLVGAVTMLASNVMFGQGPWTPWQMFAMGIVGFLAGVLFRKGLLRRTRLSLAVFGGLAAVLIYGGIMNPASALLWQSAVNGKILLAYYAAGLPLDLIQAGSTVLFLWVLARPMLEKLDRIKVKYGLVEAADQ